MDIWDADPLANFIGLRSSSLSPNELLPKKINLIKLTRDTDFNIIMEISSPEGDNPRAKEVPLGTVSITDNSIDLSSPYGTGSLHNVSLLGGRTDLSSINKETATQTKFHVQRINFNYSAFPAEYTIDQIGNLPDHYIWPNGTHDLMSGQHTITFNIDPPIEVNIAFPRIDAFSNNCAKFLFGDQIAIIAKTDSTALTGRLRPGVIYYPGNPDDDTREKIRASLSFAFGLPLVYFSTSFFRQNGKIVSFQSTTPSTMGGKAWSVISQPFAPIATQGFLDIHLLQKLAQSFFNNYGPLNLREFLFQLWHAEISPPYMKAAYYGSMIESIQKRESKKLDTKINSTIIEKSAYKKSAKLLVRFIQKQDIPEEAKALFMSKIQNGNSVPQRVLADRFYTALGLNIGTLELSAWDKRNDAAHGNEQTPGLEIENFRSIKILRIILARILLKIIEGSSNYIDYYTFNHPIRNLADTITENTEQKPQ
ncbi:hypothetical protein NHG95_01135 [Pseudomonas corrugata]|uniref:hypothetical protein n=1 Tax=Pseudomonas corrugata TaxID=47879 RepID=UPI0028C4B5DD|nr:hypothetical protein [Pseudomonas corrugata]MDU9031738.1 hypothetical protein [Pseudomonas corrugata]MDU9037262.1 hypothetical protein [Pseudomonas corrugata]